MTKAPAGQGRLRGPTSSDVRDPSYDGGGVPGVSRVSGHAADWSQRARAGSIHPPPFGVHPYLLFGSAVCPRVGP